MSASIRVLCVEGPCPCVSPVLRSRSSLFLHPRLLFGSRPSRSRLISTRTSVLPRHRVGFSSGGWTLHRGNLLLARGPKVHSLYPLYVTLISVSCLWLIFGRYPRVILIAWMTSTPQQGRHHVPIQSWIHPETLLLRPSVLRELPIRQTGSRITPDINTKRIETAQFGPLGRLWPDATSVTWWCFVLRQFY